MNKKEWIEKSIKNYQEVIIDFEKMLLDDENSFDEETKEEVKLKIQEYKMIIKTLQELKDDLNILETLKNHLYVASGLVELKITSQEYANIHKVKYYNGIPIVNQQAINQINKWYYSKNGVHNEN